MDYQIVLHIVGAAVSVAFSVGVAITLIKAKLSRSDEIFTGLKKSLDAIVKAQNSIWKKIDLHRDETDKRLDAHDVKIGVNEAHMGGVNARLANMEKILLEIQKSLMERRSS